VSLALALTAVDGLVLAADSRITDGYTLDGPRTRDDSVKFVQLNDSWGVLTYGNAEIGNQGILSLQKEISRDGPRFESLPNLLEAGKEVFNKTSLDWGKLNSAIARREKDVGFMLGGWDRQTDSFQTFSLQSPVFDAKSARSGCLLGGQWHMSKFFISKFNWKSLNVEQMKTLVVLLFDATMAVDIQVGGPIRLATVTRDAAFQWTADDEVETLRRRCVSSYESFWNHCCSALTQLVNGDGERIAG
jgi:predicted proteasome-type protease